MPLKESGLNLMIKTPFGGKLHVFRLKQTSNQQAWRLDLGGHWVSVAKLMPNFLNR